MLKLELVRFSFAAKDTIGVMHSRDGWSCFTREAVVLNTVTPPPGKAALGEGLYRLHLRVESPMLGALELLDVEGEPPVSRIFEIESDSYRPGDIIVASSADTITRDLPYGYDTYRELLRMVANHPEAYINIRHLDNTQLHHFQRMTRKGTQ